MRDQPEAPSSPIALLEMIAGSWMSQAIYVAARLGIAAASLWARRRAGSRPNRSVRTRTRSIGSCAA